MLKKLLFSALICLGLFSNLSAQDGDISWEDLEELEQLLDEDSTMLMSLLDSLIHLDDSDFKQSQLSFKVGYMSQIVTAGRDLGIEQYGLSYGVSYYHHSGVYGDVSGYWNSESDPKYYLTNTSVGYIGAINKAWSYIISYDHYFYTQSDSAFQAPYSDGLIGAIYCSKDVFDTGISYSVNFGQAQTAHKIIWSINANINKKDFWFFDKLYIRPTVSMLLGNSSILLTTFSRENRRLNINIEENNVFGLMNYGITLPISLKKDNFGFLLTYQYNIPIELPGEEFDLNNNSFFGLNASYSIKL